jgi:hypothetical protein
LFIYSFIYLYLIIFTTFYNLNQDEYSWPCKIMISHIPMQVWKWMKMMVKSMKCAWIDHADLTLWLAQLKIFKANSQRISAALQAHD